MSQPQNIRPVTTSDEDIAALEAIARETFIDTFQGTTSDEDMYAYLDTAYAQSALREEIENPESSVYFIEVDGEAAAYTKVNVGSAQTEPMGDEYAELQRIYVSPSFKRQGLGKQLMEFAQEWARERGKTKMWLGVWENNDAAQAFYAGLGFVRVGEHTFVTGSEEQIDWIFAVDL